MTLHIALNGTKGLCGRRSWVALSFRAIVQHVEFAAALMRWFGCQECRDALEDALITARPVR